MKESDLLPTSAAAAAAAAKPAATTASDTWIFGKGRYKFWALAAIVLLAFWSMLAGTVTLKWSAGNLNRITDDLDAVIHDDLDVLEMEEKEKVVRHMWDVYAHGHQIRLPRFWQEAFEAAYEELAGQDSEARAAAVAEIARMSMRMLDLDPPPHKHHPKDAEHQKNQIDGVSIATSKPSTSSSVEAQ